MNIAYIFLGFLHYSMSILAIPMPESNKLDTPAVYRWHGCGGGIFCHTDADCIGSEECIQTAGGDSSHVHCGQDSYPNSCWAEFIGH
ncbi:hypothetical protein BDV59DRAFT_56639 [Aspergillus ambiguus]|uniref:uncharacterized protein n=1 Tax=Aspergillus ambiguus TaxID=176160 RepID=UPI003CCCBAAD